MKTTDQLISTARLLDLPWFEKTLVPLIVKHKSVYKEIEKLTGIPAGFIASIHVRENGPDVGKFKTYLGNGQPLNKVTTIVPKGRGPFKNWVEGAIDALSLHNLQDIKDWDLKKACYEWERYNGFGYKDRGKYSPYVWTGTQYGLDQGYYTSDGNYSSTAKDENIGCYALYTLLIKADSDFIIKYNKEADPQKPNALFDFFMKMLEFMFNLFTPKMSESLAEKIIAQNPNIKLDEIQRALGFVKQASSSLYMLYVDFNLHSSVERAFLINLVTGKTEMSEHTTVGKYSDENHDGWADSFGNISGSGKSSLGAMITAEEYGKSVGGWSKFAEALKLKGLEKGLNDKVYDRAIIIHDSTYSENGGRSLGCITFDKQATIKLIDHLGSGSIVYVNHKSLKGIS